MSRAPTRRRFIGISAAAAGLSLLPCGWTGAAEARAVTWHGQALGAPATLTIHHHDRAAAERLVERAAAETARLERVFSLYRDASALSELNRIGVLAAPPPELVDVLGLCAAVGAATAGAFDPTVQPLFVLHARHFSMSGADPAGPAAGQIGEALGRVGFDGVEFSRDRIAMRPGMALTLNGIAQGYITDRIVDLLRAGGIASSLVDMGEIRALGARPDATPWRVGLVSPSAGAPPSPGWLEIVDKAVATSSPDGFHFDPAGRFSHLFDPRTGLSSARRRNVTVVAPEAATADALSTAFSLMEESAIAAFLAGRRGVRAYLSGDGGTVAL